ncbi:putative P-loop containing nucleoside triphosphate hydrolase [Rosa chinensis]|uniref:Putative P-loop containing nucleoside triphosphate hydrolase n=1 Tax=Rosa chinensis TaxID=74649 RepID=A0A2P6PQW2_ROSCH|nr:putative P-loop containing nucleoside triphosphate hydrolase [Rosa chinensis]
MTPPQILLDALRKAFLTIEAVCLMVMDECHRATGSHPYTKIMKVDFVVVFLPFLCCDLLRDMHSYIVCCRPTWQYFLFGCRNLSQV